MVSKAPKEPQLYFDRPTVSRLVYMAKGPSGWPETFPRKQLDAALADYLGAAPMAAAIETFILQRELSDRPTTWHTVIGFLARLREISPLDVPPEIGLAFWGQIELSVNK